MCSLWLFVFKKKSLNWLTAPSFGTKWCCSSNADISEVAAVASVNRFSQFWKVLNYFSIREFYSNYLQRTQTSSELFWLSWFVWIYWTPVFQCYTYRPAAALPALKKNTQISRRVKKTYKKRIKQGRVASTFSMLFIQLIVFRALVGLWTQDVVSFAWGLTSSQSARSLWHQHVVLSQHVPLCSQKPHSSDSGAPEKSWKGHLAVEVKGMSFRDSRTCLYSLLSSSSERDRYCP